MTKESRNVYGYIALPRAVIRYLSSHAQSLMNLKKVKFKIHNNDNDCVTLCEYTLSIRLY